MKKVLIGLAVLVLVYLGLCVTGPSEITVSKSRTMTHSTEAVFGQINSFENWENWSPWYSLDSNASYTYLGEAGEGSSACWESDHPDVGSGCEKILESKEDSLVLIEMKFDGQGGARTYFSLSESDLSETKVEWVFLMKVSFLQRAFMHFVNFEEKIGPAYVQGLANLDTYLLEFDAYQKVEESIVSANDSTEIDTPTAHNSNRVSKPNSDKVDVKVTPKKTAAAVDAGEVTGASMGLPFVDDNAGKLVDKPVDSDLMNAAFNDVSIIKNADGKCADNDLGGIVLLMNNSSEKMILVKMSLVWKDDAKEKHTIYREYTVKHNSIREIGCTLVNRGSRSKVKWSIIHTEYVD